MADNTTLSIGTGGDIIATDDIAGIKHQRVKIEHGADGAATDVSTASPLPTVLQTAQAADGAALPGTGVQVGGTDGTVFQVLSTDNAGRANVNVNGTVPVSGPLTDAQLRATAVPVSGPLTDTQLRATPVPVSGTVTASGPLTDAQLRATAVPVDTELPAAGALADAAANPTAPAVGAFALLWNGTTWDRTPGGATNGLTTNVKALNGTAIDTNSGVKSAGTQRVILASDQTVVPVSDNAGSLTVDAPVGTPAFVRLSDGTSAIATLPVSLASLPALTAGTAAIGKVGLDPQTSGGLSTFHLVSAASTNATNVKASAGQVFGWFIYNSNAAARKVVFHNTAGTPTAGASVFFAIVIPAGAGANVEFANGIAFGTGIAITTVTGLADTDATAVAVNDLILNLFYK